jgi:hypothetical protein
MNLTIKNFRGAATALFDLQKITLIGGHNAAGKSSIAQATAAALTGNPLPVRGVQKSAAGCLVRSGTAAGLVELTAETGSTKIDYPKATVKTEGQPPQATAFAVGMSCVLDLPAKDRAETLSQYLRAEPTKDDLIAGLKHIEDLKPEHFDAIWQRIEQSGWDGAHAESKEKGARLKGQWEQVTGQRYGKKKADSYIPEAYSADLEGASETDLQAVVVDAREKLEGAIAAEAVDDARAEELQTLADTLPAIEKQLPDAEKLVADMAEELEKRHLDHDKLPLAKKGDFLSCPHCRKSVGLVGGKLLPASDPLSDDEVKTRQKAIDAATKLVEAARSDNQAAARSLQELNDRIDAAKSAAEELAEQPESTATGTDIDAARSAVDMAEQRLECWKKKVTAGNRHYNIGVNSLILTVLAADGARLSKLRKCLAAANSALNSLCDVARWGVVELSDDLDASLNGTPYYLLSESEQYRVRVTVQLWMAQLDGSAAVIIDGADVLVDKNLRNGLFRALAGLDVTALVAMAMPDAADLPDIAARSMGQAYWMGEGGVLVDRASAVGAE